MNYEETGRDCRGCGRGGGAWNRFSVVLHRVDQIHRAVAARLAPQGEVAREVVEDVQRAQGARQRAFVRQVQVFGNALAEGEGGGVGVFAGGRAFEADFVQTHAAGEVAGGRLPAAAQQNQGGLLQHGGLGTAGGGIAAQHHPGEFFSVGQLGVGIQAHARGQG